MNNSSLSLPLHFWIQKTQVEIHQVLGQYRQTCVHRSKFSSLSSELKDFYKNLSNQISNTRTISPSESTKFRQLISLISDLGLVFQSLSDNLFLNNLILNSSNYYLNYVINFRKSFNNFILSLGLCSIKPLNEDLNIIESENLIDNNNLLSRLEEFKNNSKVLELIEEISKKSKKESKNELNKNNNQNLMKKEEIEEGFNDFKRYLFKIDEFEIQKKIGSGAFADVYLAYQKTTGRVVAMKKFIIKNINKSSFQEFRYEIETFSKFQHFSLLPFVGFSIDPSFVIFTDFMSNGSLFSRLQCNNNILSPTKLTIIALGIAYGMKYLHQNQMFHGDLKSLNVLLDADDFPKICDYGSSKLRTEQTLGDNSNLISTPWIAPEVLSSYELTQSSDVYSYGVLLWEMLTKDTPFRGLTDSQISLLVINNDSRPLIPQNSPPKLSKLIRICWDKDPKRRPSFEMIIKAFESGEILFPGTNVESLNAFKVTNSLQNINFIGNNSQIIAKDEKEFQILIQKMLKGNEKESIEATSIINKMLVDNKWVTILLRMNTIPDIVALVDGCTCPYRAAELVKLIYLLIQKEEIALSLNSNFIATALLNLFMRLGTTSMPKFIESFQIALSYRGVKLNGNNLLKLAQFLKAGDMSLRLSMISLLLLIF